MTTCVIHDEGSIELYFYDELGAAERAELDIHVRQCRVCAAALEELSVIRSALASRPDIADPASGDWSAFMERLDRRLATEPRAAGAVSIHPRREAWGQVRGLLAMAALLAIVAASVFFASRAGRQAVDPVATPAPRIASDGAGSAEITQAGLASVGARHLERSKLVVLGLATREGNAQGASDWAYERELATSLLNDTRLYRIAAEQRGLTSLAGVMRDLELVLLQTSMAAAEDESALPQIQRLIRKRGLVAKMEVVGTTGLVP